MTLLRIEAVAHGGDGIARLDGKTVFVRGAIPGDVVRVAITQEKKRFARAHVVEVVEAGRDRVSPPCPYFGVCGGCSWQHAHVEAQRRWKERTVREQLAHIGSITDVEVRSISWAGEPFGYRNRMDFRTQAGIPTLFAARSHDQIGIEACLLLVEPLAAILEELPPVNVPGHLTLRAGLRTGDVAIVVEPEAVEALTERSFPASTEEEAAITEIVSGTAFRVSGRAFFQANTEAADVLVEAVREAAGPVAGLEVLDAYAGVGLFAGTVGRAASKLTAIEADLVAADDLRLNLGDDVALIAEPVETGLSLVPGRPDVVIVDPPRAGLGEQVVAGIVELEPPVVVSVSCDPASFARDARAFVGAGYRLEWIQPVDLFPQTPHIETVARFVRS
jgi:23S rRNA (uracil1939-C5)-methyltransferase